MIDCIHLSLQTIVYLYSFNHIKSYNDDIIQTMTVIHNDSGNKLSQFSHLAVNFVKLATHLTIKYSIRIKTALD